MIRVSTNGGDSSAMVMTVMLFITPGICIGIQFMRGMAGINARVPNVESPGQVIEQTDAFTRCHRRSFIGFPRPILNSFDPSYGVHRQWNKMVEVS